MTKPLARINPLIEGPIARTLFFFTLPILASNVLQSLNGSVNAIWVGHYLGEAALTATSNANTILFFLIALVFGVGMASAILIGQSVGARNLEQAKRVVGNGAAFFVVGSIAIASTGAIFTAPLLTFMQTPDDAMPFAIAYLRIIFAGIPFLFLYTFVMMVLRGAGDSKTPFWFLLFSVALDIVLNPLLIFGVGPLPRMGIAGSAVLFAGSTDGGVSFSTPKILSNNAFQPTRCAALALQDRRHFESCTDLSNPYPRSGRLNASR